MPHVVEPHDASPGIDIEHDNTSITAARLLAFAITALLISFLVIDRTRGALAAGAEARSSELRAGTLALSDDDGGRTLFDLTELLPGHVLTNCIRVTYAGTVFDGTVQLRARGGGELAPDLDVGVLAGGGGGFGDCAGFRADETLFHGTLAELVTHHGPDGKPIPAMSIDEARETRTFQVTFTLRDDPAAQGRRAAVDFLWSVKA
jgi:hypothetical protein